MARHEMHHFATKLASKGKEDSHPRQRLRPVLWQRLSGGDRRKLRPRGERMSQKIQERGTQGVSTIRHQTQERGTSTRLLPLEQETERRCTRRIPYGGKSRHIKTDKASKEREVTDPEPRIALQQRRERRRRKGSAVHSRKRGVEKPGNSWVWCFKSAQ